MGSKNVILILAASLFFPMCPMLVTPLIAGFSGSIGVPAAMTGLFSGAMYLCALICRPFVGNLADRVNKYRVTMAGLLMMGAACLGYAFTAAPLLLLLLRFLHGAGFACCTVCMSTWLSYMLPKERIGSGMGLYGMMNALSMAISPAIGISLYPVIGYRRTFLIAVVFAAAALLTIQFVSDRGEPRPVQREPAAGRRGVSIVEPRVIPIAVIVMLFGIPYCATQSFLVDYTQARELPITVSLYFPFHAAVLLGMRLFMKGLFDRLPFRTFLLSSSACALAGILCLARMDNNLVMFLAAVFMAGGYGMMCSACQSKAILLAGEGKRGLANSTYYIGMDLGLTLGPAIGGVLYGSIDLAWFYPALLVTVPLTLLVYFIAARKVPL